MSLPSCVVNWDSGKRSPPGGCQWWRPCQPVHATWMMSHLSSSQAYLQFSRSSCHYTSQFSSSSVRYKCGATTESYSVLIYVPGCAWVLTAPVLDTSIGFMLSVVELQSNAGARVRPGDLDRTLACKSDCILSR